MGGSQNPTHLCKPITQHLPSASASLTWATRVGSLHEMQSARKNLWCAPLR